MSWYVASEDFRGAEFVDLDMSGTLFREVDLSGARMYGVLLTDADLDGDITGLRVNGVEVAPLIEAELDRLHPERTKLRPDTPEGMRQAWAVLESMWAPTMRRAQNLTVADLHRSVNEEWSFTETLRHLVFVTDAWFRHAVEGQARAFHPLGLPASFMSDPASLGITIGEKGSFEDVVRARAERYAMVSGFLSTVTQAELDRVREPNDAPGWPPPAPRTAISCLHVLFNEEWAHHQFAVRDLTAIEAQR